MKRRESASPLLIGDLMEAQEDTADATGEQLTRFITPSGAKVFRASISGVLMEKENIGTSENPIFRLRVADPTGGMSVMVGKFNPDLLAPAGSLQCPCFISIVGRVKTFVGKKGENIVTLNPELITRLEREERQGMLLWSIRESLSRLWTMTGRGPHPDRGLSVRPPSHPRGGEEVEMRLREMLSRAIEAYDRSFHARFLDAARTIKGDMASQESVDPLEDYEDEVVEMVRGLDSGKGARWDSLIDYIDSKRLSRDLIEEVISRLLDKGLLYEPVLGYLKAI